MSAAAAADDDDAAAAAAAAVHVSSPGPCFHAWSFLLNKIFAIEHLSVLKEFKMGGGGGRGLHHRPRILGGGGVFGAFTSTRCENVENVENF